MHAIPLTVTTVLLGAAKLLRDRDWGTMTLESPDQRQFCIIGAIQRVALDARIVDPVVRDELVVEATYQLGRTIWEFTGDARPDPATWNDRTCKSKDEAIAMLERAAGAAR